MKQTLFPASHPRRLAAVAALAVAAVAVVPAAAFAQDPAATPEAGGLVVTSDPSGTVLITRSVSADGGTFQVVGGCGEPGLSVGGVSVGGVPAPDVTISGTSDVMVSGVAAEPLPQVVMGEAGMGGCTSGTFVVGGPDTVMGGPGALMGGPGAFPGPWAVAGPTVGAWPAQSGIVTVSAEPGRVVTVTGVNGTTVSLKTDDGWTRDLETGNVAITLDADTLTAADLQVGDQVQVVQVRNANDTYTVTGLQLVLPQVAGTVSAVDASGFTVTAPDGTATPVVVTGDTRWVPAGPGATTGIESLKDGDTAFVRGRTAEDGTLTAHEIMVAGSIAISMDPGMPVPPAPVESFEPAPTPEASSAG